MADVKSHVPVRGDSHVEATPRGLTPPQKEKLAVLFKAFENKGLVELGKGVRIKEGEKMGLRNPEISQQLIYYIGPTPWHYFPDEVLRALDKDGDHHITLEEFIAWWNTADLKNFDQEIQETTNAVNELKI